MRKTKTKSELKRHKTQIHKSNTLQINHLLSQTSKKTLQHAPSTEIKDDPHIFSTSIKPKPKISMNMESMRSNSVVCLPNKKGPTNDIDIEQVAPSQQKNNIKVYCRFRPVNEVESGLLATGVGWLVPSISDNIVTIDTHKSAHQGPSFSFDKIFDISTQQESVYEAVGKGIVNDVIGGYNGTIFAYGQSGSGKTFTMYGNEDSDDQSMKGLIPRIVEDVFNYVQTTDDNVKFQIKLSVFQIYKEVIYDLLTGEKDLKIKENPIKGIYVEGLSEVYLTNIQDFEDYSNLAQQNRIVSGTKLNQYSSRSHSIMILEVTQTFTKENLIKKGTLNLVDLAGSEKVSKTGAVGETLEEAKKINLSLSALGNVIHALTSSQEHIPYRDSKLTRILQESLGGNFKTSLIITCSPHSFHLEETLSSLQFAQRAKTIKNKVKVNIKLSYDELQSIINKLKKKLMIANEEIMRLKKGKILDDTEVERISDKEDEGDNETNARSTLSISKCPNCSLMKEQEMLLNEKIQSFMNQIKEKDEMISKLRDEVNDKRIITESDKEDEDIDEKNNELLNEIKEKISKIEEGNKKKKDDNEEEQNELHSQISNIKQFIESFNPKNPINIDSLVNTLNDNKDISSIINSYKEVFEKTIELTHSKDSQISSYFLFEYLNFFFSERLLSASHKKLINENASLIEINSILLSIIEEMLSKNIELNYNINTQTNVLNIIRGSIIDASKEENNIKQSISNNNLRRFSFVNFRRDIKNNMNSSKFLSFVSRKNIDIKKNMNSGSNKVSFINNGSNSNTNNNQNVIETYTPSKFEPMTPKEPDLFRKFPAPISTERTNFAPNESKQSKFEMLRDVVVRNIKEGEKIKNVINTIKNEFNTISKLNRDFFINSINKKAIIPNDISNITKAYETLGNIKLFSQSNDSNSIVNTYNYSYTTANKDKNSFRKENSSHKKYLSGGAEHTNRKLDFDNMHISNEPKFMPKEKKLEDFISQYLETGTATRRFDGIKVQFEKNNKVRCLYATGLSAENKIAFTPIQKKHITQIKGDNNDSVLNESNVD